MVDENYFYYSNADLSEYVGQWIAIIDKKRVSSATNAKEAYYQAKKAFPDKSAFSCVRPKSSDTDSLDFLRRHAKWL